MLSSVLAALPEDPQAAPEDRQTQSKAAAAALAALGPRDPIEAMQAARIVASHYAAMDCFRRSASHGLADPSDLRLYNAAASLSRVSADGLRALEKRRGRASRVNLEAHVVTESTGTLDATPAPDNIRYLPSVTERTLRKR
jgi:hypothetical protein